MTDYKAIVGKGIKVVSTNLDNAEAEGQIWFNSTTGEFKNIVNLEAWSSSGSLATTRYNMGSGNTPVTAGLIFGGTPGKHTATENYDGTGWSAGGALGTGRYQLSGFGTQTAGLGAGGYASPAPGDKALVEEYNGTSWSEVNDLPAARRGAAGFGTQTAGAIAGGVPNLNTTLHYDGTNWTSGGTLPAGQDRTEGGGTGTLTAGFLAAGDNRTSFEYDGSSWTAGPSTSSDHDGGSDTGIQTAAITFGGFPSPGSGRVTSTELYNGTSFTTSPATMANGRYGIGNGGFTGTSAFAGGGDKNPGTIADTEEYNSSTNVITGAVWASGGSASNSARTRALAGTQTAAFMSGGYVGANNQTRDTEHYDGSSWTSGGDLVAQGNNPPGGTYGGSAVGTQTAGLFAGGSSQGSTDYYFNTSYEYDGSSWGSPATFTSPGLAYLNMFGTQTAAVSGGGVRPGQPYVRNYEYDGSSWSSGEDLPVGRAAGGSAGTLTAGIIFGGYNPGLSPPALTTSKHYDGTNWTAGGDMNFGSNGGGSNGTQTAALAIRGDNGSGDVASCQQYDGSTWTITATAATVVSGLRNGAGTTSAALSAGGSPSAVEEFTGATDTETAVTLTTS